MGNGSDSPQSEVDDGRASVPLPSVLDYSRLSPLRPVCTFGGQMIKAAVIGTVALFMDAYSPYPSIPFLYGLVVWFIVAVATVLRHWVRVMPEVPEGPRWKAVVGVLFLLAFVTPVRVHHCDHATTYANMVHWGISYSRTGGPCNNAPHCGGRHVFGNWYLAGLY